MNLKKPLIILLIVFIIGFITYPPIFNVTPFEINVGFSLKKVEFGNKDEYVISNDINNKKNNIVVLTSTKIKSETFKGMGNIYVLNQQGIILQKRNIGEISPAFERVVYGVDDNIYLINENVYPKTKENIVKSRYDEDLNNLPIDLNYIKEEDIKFKFSRDFSTTRRWNYKINENVTYYYECTFPDLFEGGCASQRSAISKNGRVILFINKSLRMPRNNKYTLNNGAIVIIMGYYDPSRSNDYNKLYIIN